MAASLRERFLPSCISYNIAHRSHSVKGGVPCPPARAPTLLGLGEALQEDATESTVRATVEQGTLRGSCRDDLAVFRGVPFAAAPVGTRRWRRPQPPPPWLGERDATSPGAMSIQPPPNAATAVPGDPTEQSEDCLFLNVWAPWPPGEALPVMVFLHGGGFVGGSAASLLYDGSALATAGVVLVTVNYRLGALGWLAHPALDDGEEGAAPGNFGLYDQLSALEWLQRNVGSFGGDASRVTLFGESAGAMSVAALLSTAAAGTLVRRAVLQSGPAAAMGGESAEDVARQFARELALERLDRERLEGLATDDILRAQGAVRASRVGVGPPFQPVVDGELLAAHPASLIAAHGVGGIELMVGTNKDEWRFWSLSDPNVRELGEGGLVDYVRGHLEAAGLPGCEAENLVTTFRAAREGRGQPAGPSDLHTALSTDWVFRVPAMRLAEAAVRRGSTVYAYLFEHESPFAGGLLGACHALELPFVFGTYRHPMIGVFSGTGPEVEELSRMMVAGWTSFAATGCPTLPGGPAWLPYETTRRATLRLGEEVTMSDAPMDPERAALAEIFGPYGEMEARLAPPRASSGLF